MEEDLRRTERREGGGNKEKIICYTETKRKNRVRGKGGDEEQGDKR